MAKKFKILQKWWYLAKSGHTESYLKYAMETKAPNLKYSNLTIIKIIKEQLRQD